MNIASMAGRRGLPFRIGYCAAKAGQIGMMQPKLLPLLGKMLLFFVRGFGIGRDLETAFELTIQELENDVANPKPKPPLPSGRQWTRPTPREI